MKLAIFNNLITEFNSNFARRKIIFSIILLSIVQIGYGQMVQLSVNTNTATEAAGTIITATATASAAVSGNQTVTIAATGTGITATDYNWSGTTITILDGATTGSVTFTILDDADIEGTETATLTISNPSAGITLGTNLSEDIVITDNDFPSVQLSVNTNTATEAAGTIITATATASAAVSGNQTVTIAATGTGITATDYNWSGTTITILDGATTGSVTFTILDDADVEGTETATLTISNPSAGITLGATTAQNIVITDNDFPSVQLSVNTNTATEAAGTIITATATASAAVSGNQTVTIAASGTGITATDYSWSGTTITILDGATTGSVTFTILDDADIEGTETATLTISNPSAGITLGANLSENIVITDNDFPSVQLSVSPSAGTEAAGTIITATATASAAVSGNQTVTIAATGTGITATDYNWSGTTITILDGATTGSVTFTILDDADIEGTETATLTISNPSAGITLGANLSEDIVITDNDFPSVQLSVNTNTATEAAGTIITATATASAAVSGNQTVTIAATGTGITATDYNWSGTTITILDGATTGLVTFTILDDADIEGTETATLTISNPSAGITLGANLSENIVITDNELIPVNLSLSANARTEGNLTTITITATSTIAVTGAQSVDVSISGTNITAGDYSLSNSTINIADNTTSGNITITITDDALYELSETLQVSFLNYSSGLTAGVTTSDNIIITDNDTAPTVTLSSNSPIAEDGGISTITATLSAIAGVDVTVNLGFGGTATGGGTDYTTSGNSISITAES
ncbi:MAG: hypothetical protein L3J06_08720, partial [Cyclobacteriaceae bacterium]|nr:hypothetical protein [Cyclobacteriaceae bacterium]